MDEIGAAQARFEVRSRIAPEALRRLEVRRRRGGGERPAKGGGAAFRIPEEIAERRVQNKLKFPSRDIPARGFPSHGFPSRDRQGASSQGANQPVGIETAAGACSAGLADIEPDRTISERSVPAGRRGQRCGRSNTDRLQHFRRNPAVPLEAAAAIPPISPPRSAAGSARVSGTP